MRFRRIWCSGSCINLYGERVHAIRVEGTYNYGLTQCWGRGRSRKSSGNANVSTIAATPTSAMKPVATAAMKLAGMRTTAVLDMKLGEMLLCFVVDVLRA